MWAGELPSGPLLNTVPPLVTTPKTLAETFPVLKT